MKLKATEEVLKLEGVLDAIADFGIKLKNQRKMVDGTFEFDVDNITEEGYLDLFFSKEDDEVEVTGFNVRKQPSVSN